MYWPEGERDLTCAMKLGEVIQKLPCPDIHDPHAKKYPVQPNYCIFPKIRRLIIIMLSGRARSAAHEAGFAFPFCHLLFLAFFVKASVLTS